MTDLEGLPALDLLLAKGKRITSDAVRALAVAAVHPEVPHMRRPAVDLASYDALLVDDAMLEVGT